MSRGFWYRQVGRPLLFQFDPEQVHHAMMALLAALGPWLPKPGTVHPKLARTVFGLDFPNPIGLAAGFDKNAVALPAWAALGFGFAEVGTVTALPQPGNPRPRIFRVPEQRALINRLGFNNDGAVAVAARLQQLRQSGNWPRIPVGINLGKSRAVAVEEAVADYVASFRALRELGDYFVLNVSSPNTPGLRSLQDRAALGELLRAVQAENLAPRRPLLVKIAPDLTWPAVAEVLAVAEENQLAGLIATNTTLDQAAVPESRRTAGGLSGPPLRARATEVVRFISKRSQLPVIAVGGIQDAASAREKFDAGAVLIQLYTGFIYEGPALVRALQQAMIS